LGIGALAGIRLQYGGVGFLELQVSGRIVELDVRDNQAVREGDVLFRIDPDPYRMRVDQARAAVQV
jgi:multidrug resistance efflux pump